LKSPHKYKHVKSRYHPDQGHIWTFGSPRPIPLLNQWMPLNQTCTEYLFLLMDISFFNISTSIIRSVITLCVLRVSILRLYIFRYYSDGVIIFFFHFIPRSNMHGVRSGRDRMIVGFTTTSAISAYHHWRYLLHLNNNNINKYLNFNFVSVWYMPLDLYCTYIFYGLVWFMVFKVTFNNICVTLWRSVLLVEETGYSTCIHDY
jgi:hypothetical protein